MKFPQSNRKRNATKASEKLFVRINGTEHNPYYKNVGPIDPMDHMDLVGEKYQYICITPKNLL